MQTKRLKRNIGNILIVLSIFFLGLIYYPIIQIYLFPPKVQEFPQTKAFVIQINKIGVLSKIIENVDPFEEEEYQEALKVGVAQAKGTFLPGQKGTIFIFGHSSQPPWEITRVNTSFLRLGELENGDIVTIRKDEKKFEYVVYDKKTVWPTEVQYLKETKKDQLILQTCTPIGTSLQRLLIFAKPK